MDQIGQSEFAKELARMEEVLDSTAFLQWNSTYIQFHVLRLTKAWEHYQLTQMESMSKGPATDKRISLIEDDVFDMSCRWEAIEIRLQSRLADFRSGKAKPVQTEKISVPAFSGRINDWPEWRSTFKDMVLDRELAADFKLKVLRLSVPQRIDNALGTVSDDAATELRRAWQVLDVMFASKDSLGRHHMATILDYPTVPEDDWAGVQKLIDQIASSHKMLIELGFDEPLANITLGEIVLRKLGRKLHADYEKGHASWADLPKVLQFLEDRLLSAWKGQRNPRTQTGPSNSGPRQSRQPSVANAPSLPGNSHAVSTTASQKEQPGETKPICPMRCGIRHKLYLCSQFRDRSTVNRGLLVDQFGLCRCCLAPGHEDDECTQPGCERCNGEKHNNILCPRYQRKK